jgi:acylphosphatase
LIARRAIVTGRVQGVGFRFFAERAARRTGVRGWVRNLPDGSVETVVEGEEPAVMRYLDDIRKGPLGGRVTDIRVEERDPERLESFHITT